MACFGRSFSCSLAGDFEGRRPPPARWPPAKGSRQRLRSQGVYAGQTGFHPRAWICPRSSRICRRSSQFLFKVVVVPQEAASVANPTRQEGRTGEGDHVGGRNCSSGRFRSHMSHVEGGALARASPVADRIRSSASAAARRGQRGGLPGGPTHRPVQFCAKILLSCKRNGTTSAPKNSGDREDRERKQPRTLASPAVNLVPLNRNTVDRTVVTGGQLPSGSQSSASPSAASDLDQAMEFDLTLRVSTDEEVLPTDPHDPPCGSLSDTERQRRPRRRLRLIWQLEQGADTAHHDVRAASQLVEALARRVGCNLDGTPLPRAILQQSWSPFNVPLMWSAAGTSATTTIVEWMVGASRGLHGTRCRCRSLLGGVR